MSTSKKNTQAKPEQIQTPVQAPKTKKKSADPKPPEFYIKHIGQALECLRIVSNAAQNEDTLYFEKTIDYECYYSGLDTIIELAEQLHTIYFDVDKVADKVNARFKELAAE